MVGVLMALAVPVWGQDALEDLDQMDSLDSLESLTVVGSSEAVWDLVGSAAYLEAEEYRERGYTNIGKILAQWESQVGGVSTIELEVANVPGARALRKLVQAIKATGISEALKDGLSRCEERNQQIQ